MQSYPSIEAWNDRRHAELIGQPCYIFYKYDGSNLRFELKGRELVKIGTRTRLMDINDPQFGPAIPYFVKNILPDACNKIYSTLDTKLLRNAKRMVLFGEWFGPNSFAGSHDPDDEMQLKLFDLHVGNHGLINGSEFIKIFGSEHEHGQQLLYAGRLESEHIDQVRRGSLEETPLPEGVVIHVSAGSGDWERVKVKTTKWLDRVRAKYGDDWEKHA